MESKIVNIPIPHPLLFFFEFIPICFLNTRKVIGRRDYFAPTVFLFITLSLFLLDPQSGFIVTNNFYKGSSILLLFLRIDFEIVFLHIAGAIVNADKTEQVFSLRDKTANPAPLGLLGFGMTTILLNLHNAGLMPLDVVILAMGMFYGGLAQITAGIMEWKKNNTFGTVAFISYGFFWISLCTIILLPKTNLVVATTPFALGSFLTLWGIMSLGMFIGTFKTTKALSIVFGLLVILFLLLAVRDFSGNEGIGIFAGYEGIICGAMALYTGIAQIINEMFKREIMPLGAYKK